MLLPSWHHGSEVEAVRRAGLAWRFYDVGESLEPDEQELERLLGPRVRALHLTHFLGFPQDAGRWRAWCDERELLLIEDAAQAWLASRGRRPVGSHGDLAVFCLYKTVGLPEGAAMICSSPPDGVELDRRVGASEILRRHGAWLAGRSALANGLTRPLQRSAAVYDPEEDFSLRDPESGPWASTLFLLRRLSDPAVAAQRRANYRLLLEGLGDEAAAPFRDLPEGASPFAFPLATRDKPALLARLRAAGIRGLDLWSAPHPSLPVEEFPAAAERRSGIVGLPVHQELRPKDVDRVLEAARAGSTRRPELRLERIEDLTATREWEELAERSQNIFATPQWASIWWRHLGFGRPMIATAARRRDGSLACVLPLYVASTRPGRILRFIGHGLGDQLGPVCDPRDRAAAARALRRALGDASPAWDLFVGDELPADAGWEALIGGAVLRRESSPVLRLDGRTWDEYLASQSRNFREQVRRRERRLAREHDLRYRLTEDPAALEDDLATLFRLHRARWGEEGSEAFGGRLDAFHREFAACALERGWLRLWTMEVDGRPVAAWYGFRFAGAELYYQAGRDPAWDRYSTGFVLLAHTIREAFADDLHEYRLLRGGESYKGRFADADPGVATVGLARGPRGRAALAAALAARRMPQQIRRPFVKLAG